MVAERDGGAASPGKGRRSAASSPAKGAVREAADTDKSGSKTSLQSDPYHVRHGSQALARRYLQRLISANPKGSDALLIAHPL